MSTAMIAASFAAAPMTPQRSREAEMVARLARAVAQAGVRVDRSWIVNCYVALKSKPLTILAGPERSGKELLVKNLTQVLTQDVWHNQRMLGHAWWAEGTGNRAEFMEAQVRLNSSKILALIEEASLAQNRDRVFIGWLKRISPAELGSFFSELAFQLEHKRLIQLPSFYLSEPIACPPNFSMLGTIDTPYVDWSDGNLLSQTTIIPWPAVAVSPPAGCLPLVPAVPDAERVFLRSCIRSEELAFDRLHRTQGWRPHLMRPLVVVEDLLRHQQVDLPKCAVGEAMIYVANAWSQDGEGLFDPKPARNQSVALDFAIAQTLLMRACRAIRDSAVLRTRLAGALEGRFPHSLAFLRTLEQAQTKEATQRRQIPSNEPLIPKKLVALSGAKEGAQAA